MIRRGNGIRPAKVAEAKAKIAAGTAMLPFKLDVAIDRMLAELSSLSSGMFGGLRNDDATDYRNRANVRKNDSDEGDYRQAA